MAEQEITYFLTHFCITTPPASGQYKTLKFCSRKAGLEEYLLGTSRTDKKVEKYPSLIQLNIKLALMPEKVIVLATTISFKDAETEVVMNSSRVLYLKNFRGKIRIGKYSKKDECFKPEVQKAA